MKKKRKVSVIVGIFGIVFVIGSISAITYGVYKIMSEHQEKVRIENIEREYKAAISIKEQIKDIESLDFNDDGGYSGGGTWGVSAEALVAGENTWISYKDGGSLRIPGTFPGVIGSGPTTTPIQVTYSDGTRGVIE